MVPRGCAQPGGRAPRWGGPGGRGPRAAPFPGPGHNRRWTHLTRSPRRRRAPARRPAARPVRAALRRTAVPLGVARRVAAAFAYVGRSTRTSPATTRCARCSATPASTAPAAAGCAAPTPSLTATSRAALDCNALAVAGYAALRRRAGWCGPCGRCAGGPSSPRCGRARCGRWCARRGSSRLSGICRSARRSRRDRPGRPAACRPGSGTRESPDAVPGPGARYHRQCR